MPNSDGVDIMKITKLNGNNYQDWADDTHSLLILKDLWDTMHEDIPPLVHAEQRAAWTKKQHHARSLIHLSCERDQARLCANARTGKHAWEILSTRYASNDISNVMRLEEAFGQARKSPQQSMEQWIGQVSALATQLNSVGGDVPDNRISVTNQPGQPSGRRGPGLKAEVRAGLKQPGPAPAGYLVDCSPTRLVWNRQSGNITAYISRNKFINNWKNKRGPRMRQKDELEHFASSTIVETDNPRVWWIQYQADYPQLSIMALSLLAIPAMSSEVERVFSSTGLMVTDRRNGLKEDIIEAAECMKSWQADGGLVAFGESEQVRTIRAIGD